jgi:hypothetical protein
MVCLASYVPFLVSMTPPNDRLEGTEANCTLAQ